MHKNNLDHIKCSAFYFLFLLQHFINVYGLMSNIKGKKEIQSTNDICLNSVINFNNLSVTPKLRRSVVHGYRLPTELGRSSRYYALFAQCPLQISCAVELTQAIRSLMMRFICFVLSLRFQRSAIPSLLMGRK